ncbi:M20 family metallopeptidase [Halosimplex rubrum]|uniref:M20 family metallopeptidase n=1 Tax=Halosimplex rubrum TaxID=869889 RepID=A0A7D5PAT0_9EURY|nr:M20 family metallopeptidase [Halosimplex rubrum]QLH77859.1 M20 family metallopeptidase [Halosimplex rubrum]
MIFDVLEFHERAVRTESHESVEEMRGLLVETLEGAGADPVVDDAGNTLATRTGDGYEPGDEAESGSDAGTHLVLNTHIDTVPPHVPFAEREGGAVVEGRGACDAKGPLAALVDAFLSAGVGEGNRLTLAITPDEETVQTGAAHLAGTLDADGFVVGEPTGLDVCNAARGQYEGTITLTGAAAHAATPESGANAIRAVAPLLQAMESYDEREARSASDGASGDDEEPRARGPDAHESLGRPTLTPTVIDGGEASNQVPEECVITFDRRPVPPETPEEFEAGLETHLSEWVPSGIDLDVALSPRETPFLAAFATAPDEPLVEALAAASGGEVRPFGAATEASYFAEHAPTVVFGPGDLADDEGAVAHSEREYVRREEVRAAARAVRDAVDALL